MTPDTSGPTWRVPLAHYDPASSSWKTSQGMFPSDWPTSSETCPRWGMTRRGELFELPTPALPTLEAASSSSLLPTPTADDRRNSYGTGSSRDYQSLANTAVTELLPPPTARDWKDTGNFTPHPEKGRLPHTIAVLPTPKAGDGERGRDVARPRPDEASRELATILAFLGDSTPTPSPDGNGSPDDPHPHQLSLGTADDVA